MFIPVWTISTSIPDLLACVDLSEIVYGCSLISFMFLVYLLVIFFKPYISITFFSVPYFFQREILCQDKS